MVERKPGSASLPTGPITPGDLAFACWAYESITGYAGSLHEFRSATGDMLDLAKPENCGLLLTWLNKWGCRLPEKCLPNAAKGLLHWWGKHGCQLPNPSTRLVDASDSDLDAYVEMFDTLHDVAVCRKTHGKRKRLGPTATSKTLFACRPHFFPAWDRAIRDHHIRGGEPYDSSGKSYVRFLKDVRSELLYTADQCEWHGFRLDDLPKMLGRADYTTPPQLMVDYYWVVLTRDTTLPCLDQRDDWAGWSRIKQGRRAGRPHE